MRFWKTFIKNALEVILILIGFWIALVQATWVWANYAPDSFHRWLNWISGGQVQVASIEWPKQWLSPDITLHQVQFENDRFKFSAEKIQFKTKFFHEKADLLWIHHWRLKLKQPVSNASLTFKDMIAQVDLNSPRFWLPITQLKMTSGIVYTGVWQFNLPRVEWHRFKDVKARALVMTLYENTPVWAGRAEFIGQLDLLKRIKSGTLTLKTLQPMPLRNLSRVLETRWKKGELRFDAAVRYQKGQPKITVNVLLEHLRIPTKKGQPLDSLGAQLHWTPAPDAWHFSVAEWQINQNLLKNQSPAHVVLSDKTFRLEIKALTLAPFRESLATLWPQWDWRHTDLSAHDLDVHFSIKPFRVLTLQGSLQRFAWPEQKNMPGVDVRGIEMSTHNKVVQLKVGVPIQVRWAAFQRKQPIEIAFKQPIQLSRIRPGYWGMKPQELIIDNQIPGKIAFEGDLVHGKISAVLMPQTLMRIKEYLPYGLMGEELQTWLKTALVKGQVEPVQLNFSGPWKTMWSPENSTLQAQTKVRSAILRFQPDWPPLESLDATISFKPFNLKVALVSALLDGIKVGPALAEIGQLQKPDISLRVTGKANGTWENVVSLLQDSPLATQLQVDGLLKKVKVRGGHINAQVALWAPLYGYNGRKIDIDVQTQIQNLMVRLPDGTEINNLHGKFHATQQSAVSGGLKGEMFGHPITVVVKTAPQKQRLTILYSGQVPLSKYIADARGWLPFKGQIFIPMGHLEKTHFHLSAKPKLYENNLPVPLNEILQQPLNLEGSLDKNTLRFFLSMGPSLWIHGGVQLKQQKPLRHLVVLLNQPEPIRASYAKHAESGITVVARTQELKLAEWVKWWPEQVKKLPLSSATSDQLPHIDLGVNVDQMHYQTQVFRNVVLRAHDIDAQRLAFRLTSEHGKVVGIYLPDNNQMVAVVQDLKLRVQEGDKTGQCDPWGRLSNLKVFFIGNHIQLGQYTFNQVRFNMYTDPAQLRIENIQFNAQNNAVSGQAKFLWDYQAGLNTLQGHVRAKPVEEFLTWMGYPKAGFTGNKAVADFHLGWAGPPTCVSLKKLKGDVAFRFDEGVVEQADSGLAKVIGLLSIDSLLRNVRVTLKNLQYKGLAYDKIEGKAKLRHGGWAALQRFHLEAPSVVVRMKGGIDLVRRRLELKANVTPQLVGSLTTLLTIFGLTNPVTALGTYLFLKNIPGTQDGLVTYHYRIVGDWTAPKLINLDEAKPSSGSNLPKSEDDILNPE